MEKLFEMTLVDTGKNSCGLATEFAADKEEVIPLLMIAFVEGIRAKDYAVCKTFEVLKSVVESVEMNIQTNYNVTEKTFNGKDR